MDDKAIYDRVAPLVVAIVTSQTPVWLALAGVTTEREAWAGKNIASLVSEDTARVLVEAADNLFGATTGAELYAWSRRGGLKDRPQIGLHEAQEEYRALPLIVQLAWTEFAFKADLFVDLLRREAEHANAKQAAAKPAPKRKRK